MRKTVQLDVGIGGSANGNRPCSTISSRTQPFTYTLAESVIPDKPEVPNPIIRSGGSNKKDTDSWSAVRKSGKIKMTPYSKFREETSFFVAEAYKEEATGAFTDWAYPYYVEPYCGGQFVGNVTRKKYNDVRVKRTISYVTSSLNRPGKHYPITIGEFDSEVNRVKTELVKAHFDGYDALTDIAEWSSSMKTIRGYLDLARHPLREMHKLSKLAKKGGLTSELSSRWMEYRYGLTPIIASIKGLLEVADSGFKGVTYKTTRKSGSVTGTMEERDLMIPHTYENGIIMVEIRGTAKSSYSSTVDRVINQITLNPIKTAWDLTRFSFIVNWFVDIESYIVAKSQFFSSPGVDSVFCISTKVTKDITTLLHIPQQEYTQTMRPQHFMGVPQSAPIDVRLSTGGGGPIQHYLLESYNREVFQPTDVELRWFPQVSDLRKLDALALTAVISRNKLRNLQR